MYGQKLVSELPDQTTLFLKSLCTSYTPIIVPASVSSSSGPNTLTAVSEHGPSPSPPKSATVTSVQSYSATLPSSSPPNTLISGQLSPRSALFSSSSSASASIPIPGAKGKNVCVYTCACALAFACVFFFLQHVSLLGESKCNTRNTVHMI